MAKKVHISMGKSKFIEQTKESGNSNNPRSLLIRSSNQCT